MIYIELPDLEKVTKRLRKIPDAGKWALMRTLNEVAISGRQAAVDDIFARYYFDTQTPVRKGFSIQTANTSHLLAVIHVTGTRFPVAQFLPTQIAEGVDIMEVRGSRASISHVFTATMRYGTNVFSRVGPGRGPVRSITGLSVANMARESKEVLPDIESRIKTQLPKRLEFWTGVALAGKMADYGG
jgi:hypothetical protein